MSDATLKPSEFVCDDCGIALNADFTGKHYDSWDTRCTGKMSARFTRADLVRVAAAAFEVDEHVDGERVVAELLGEKTGG